MEAKNQNNSQIQIAAPKEILSLKEACAYLNLSESWMYKLTHKNQIPYYKPNGKKIYFKREDLITWSSQNRVKTSREIEAEAADYITNHPSVKKETIFKKG